MYWTHGFLGAFDNLTSLPSPPNRIASWGVLKPQDRFLTIAPFFHMMGYLITMESLFRGVPFVSPPDKPITSDFIVDIANATKPTAALFPPSVLEEMSHLEGALKALSCMKEVYFAGASLSPEVGKKISKQTKLVSLFGATETGVVPVMRPPITETDGWDGYEWNPSYGVDMRLVGEETYELVIKRSSTRQFQAVFHAFPNLNEYGTKDIFLRHPSKQNRWIYHSRIDDIIVLSNGEKFNPLTMEKIIESHPLVAHAVIAGQGHFQSSLLVEPYWDKMGEHKSDRDFLQEIWPSVQRANETAPAHARLQRSTIGVATKDKPFKTTPKGTSQRHHIYRDYAQEIDAIYKQSHADEDWVHQGLSENTTLTEIRAYIQKISYAIYGSEITGGMDFFRAGLDSLQAIQFTRYLQDIVRARYPGKTSQITTRAIYSNPTIDRLSLFMNSVINGNDDLNEFVDERSRVEKIEALVGKYTSDIPIQHLDIQTSPKKHTIILTGSTGSLGTYLLSALLDDPATLKVYCLNRSTDAATRQKSRLLENGLHWDSSREGKVEFLQASFGGEKLALADSKYDEMLRSVDTIIHNAWKVDFNLSISSFEDAHIRGVRRFIDFSLHSVHQAHLYFVSSISSIGDWKPRDGPVVPETAVENSEVTLAQGYAESKHVAERICSEASHRAGIPTTIFRVGQMGGPTGEKGAWNRREWLPTIIATSKATGSIPNDLGLAKVDWIPVVSLGIK